MMCMGHRGSSRFREDGSWTRPALIAGQAFVRAEWDMQGPGFSESGHQNRTMAVHQPCPAAAVYLLIQDGMFE
jgi:hypothetical protein